MQTYNSYLNSNWKQKDLETCNFQKSVRFICTTCVSWSRPPAHILFFDGFIFLVWTAVRNLFELLPPSVFFIQNKISQRHKNVD